MFTGIIQTIGKVVRYDGNRPPDNRRTSRTRPAGPARYKILRKRGSAEPCGGRLRIKAPFAGVRKGESISVEGVCLTVAGIKGKTLAFDVGRETQRVTTLGHLQNGSRVNLERALRVGDRLGGHWVSGHVEETGRILKIEKAKASWTFTFSVPKAMRRFVVPKGSLAIDGISLTVVSVRGHKAKVMIIPHTLRNTTIGTKKMGDRVNLEPDILAKYAQA